MTKSLLASAALLSLLPAHAAISVGAPGPAYTQNFDTLTTATTAQSWLNDSTLAGWNFFTAAGGTVPTYLGGTGSANTGSFYSYGSGNATDRAIGGLASGGAYFGSPASTAVAGYIAAAFTNTSAGAYDSFTLAFNGEQWRDGGLVGGAGTPAAQPMVLQYGFGSTFAAVTAWLTPGGSFDYSSPVFVTTTTGVAVDGNVAGRVNGLGGTIATPWVAGDTLWVRWIERNDLGNDHGLAIDDFSLSVTAVPEPAAWTLLLAGAAALAFVARRRRV